MSLVVLQQCQKSEVLNDGASQESVIKKSNDKSQKSSSVINENNITEEGENSSSNPCAPVMGGMGCEIYVIDVEVFIPGFDDCPVIATLGYERCYNKFTFFDFIMKISDNTDCDGLKQYIDNMTPDQLSDFKDYVEEEGKRTELQWWADHFDWNFIEDVTSYKNLCTQTCSWLELDCIADVLKTDKKVSRENRGGIVLRGGGPCHKFKTVKCGEGCCVTISDYVRDMDGKLVLYSSATNSNGDCETGPEPIWPHFAGDCPGFSHIVIPCHYKCD